MIGLGTRCSKCRVDIASSRANAAGRVASIRANSRSNLAPGRSMVPNYISNPRTLLSIKSLPIAEGPDPRCRAHPSATTNPNSCPDSLDSLRAREQACFGRCLATTTHHAYMEPAALSSQVGALASKPDPVVVEGGGMSCLRPMTRTGWARGYV